MRAAPHPLVRARKLRTASGMHTTRMARHQPTAFEFGLQAILDAVAAVRSPVRAGARTSRRR